MGSKIRKRSGAGGAGGEKKLGCQEEEECSKMRRRIGVLQREGLIQGEWEEGGKMTLTLHELIMQNLIAQIGHVQSPSNHTCDSFVSHEWIIHSFTSFGVYNQ